MNEKSLPSAGEFLRLRDTWIRMLVNDLDISHATARVGVHLAMRMTNTNKSAWPSTKTIARETGVHVRTVIRAITELHNADYIRAVRKRNVGNEYFFRLP